MLTVVILVTNQDAPRIGRPHLSPQTCGHGTKSTDQRRQGEGPADNGHRPGNEEDEASSVQPMRPPVLGSGARAAARRLRTQRPIA
jgi:hypothetical protein